MTENPTGPTSLEISFDEDNPRSVINLVSPAIAERIRALPADFQNITERDARKKFKPTATVERVRISFWMEYHRAQEHFKRMRMENVIGGVCSSDYFYHYIAGVPDLLTFLLIPPASYTVAMEECLNLGIERIREIMELSIYDDKGRPNAKIAEIILKAFMVLDTRVKGAIVQRIENKSTGLLIHADAKTIPAIENVDDMVELEKRIKSLEYKTKVQRNRNERDIKEIEALEREIETNEIVIKQD